LINPADRLVLAPERFQVGRIELLQHSE
jgi:hypothetical protein